MLPGGCTFFWLRNALSQDWIVAWCSNLFRLTLWTLPALFGARTPPKSMCTQRHTRLKNFDEKMHVFAVKLVWAPGGVPNVKIVKNLSIKVQLPQKSIYSTPMHLKPILWPQNVKPLKSIFRVYFSLGFSCKNLKFFTVAQNRFQMYGSAINRFLR